MKTNNPQLVCQVPCTAVADLFCSFAETAEFARLASKQSWHLRLHFGFLQIKKMLFSASLGTEITYFYHEIGLEVTFGTIAMQNRKTQMPSSANKKDTFFLVFMGFVKSFIRKS